MYTCTVILVFMWEIFTEKHQQGCAKPTLTWDLAFIHNYLEPMV